MLSGATKRAVDTVQARNRSAGAAPEQYPGGLGGDCLSRLPELVPRIEFRATGAGKPDQPCHVERSSRLPHPPSLASSLLLLLQQTPSHFAAALPIAPGFMTIMAYLAPAPIVVRPDAAGSASTLPPARARHLAADTGRTHPAANISYGYHPRGAERRVLPTRPGALRWINAIRGFRAHNFETGNAI
jgi:hypothetical protein